MTTTTTTTATAATTRVSRAMRRLQRSSAARRAAIATNAKRSVPELVDFFGGGKIHRRRPSTSSSSGASTRDSEWDEDEDEKSEDDDDGCDEEEEEEEASAGNDDPSGALEPSIAAADHGWTGVTAAAASIAVVATSTAAHADASRADESSSQLSQIQDAPTAIPAADLQYHQDQKLRAHTQTPPTLECSTPLPTGTSVVASTVIEALRLFVNALVLLMAWLVAFFTMTTASTDSVIVATPRAQLAMATPASATAAAASSSTDNAGATNAKRSAIGCASANCKIVSIADNDNVATPAAEYTDDGARDQASSCTDVYESVSAAANSAVGRVVAVAAATAATTTPVGQSKRGDPIGDGERDRFHAAHEAEDPAEVFSQDQVGDDEQDETNLAQEAEDRVEGQIHDRGQDEDDQDHDQDEDQVGGYDEDREDEARTDVHQPAQTAVGLSPVDHLQDGTTEAQEEEEEHIQTQVARHLESRLSEADNGDHATLTRASSEGSESESDTAAEPSVIVDTATPQQRPSRKSVRAVYMEYPSTERYQRHLLSTLGIRERVENLTSANLQQQQVLLLQQQQQWRW